MCCFSQAVTHVSGTQIFARPSKDKQILVYSMELVASQELAMILPLPVPPGCAEDAVRFINLQDYARFFDDLGRLFPEEITRGNFMEQSLGVSRSPLVVHDVGLFEASFVPRLADFNRLDARFRLPTRVWNSLPQYQDWGFAVFKLKQTQPPASWLQRLLGTAPPPAQHIHPMAFEFSRHDSQQLFFPTVHIHDGVVHENADFDHALYCQLPQPPKLHEWERSRLSLGEIMKVDRAAGVLHPEHAVYRRKIAGKQPNRDTVIGLE